MVRAELGNGNRVHALSLIRRVQERYVSMSFWLMPIHEIPGNTLTLSLTASRESWLTMLSHRGPQPPHPKLIIFQLQGLTPHKNDHIYIFYISLDHSQ
jgi:hypothetical protein